VVVVRAAVAVAAAAAVVVELEAYPMHRSTSIHREVSAMNILRLWALLLRLMLALTLALPLAATAAGQQTYATPEAAVDALMAALKADSDASMLAIFGDDYKHLIVRDDRAAASAERAKLYAAMQTLRVLRELDPDKRMLLIGADAWPVPFPIVRSKDRWRFATELGEDELINRRVGANERNAIYVLRAFVGAQNAFAAVDRDGDGVREYALKLASTPGKRDGLYWTADAAKGEEASPFGPLIAESAAYFEGHAVGDPYRGYRFRILTRQGAYAAGGAYNYIVNGRMIGGFAMVAYPAEWGETGVMSFIVNHNGKVFEKNLGKETAALGAKMTAFDPSPGWKVVGP
jgi:Protein of unknown function (DUF2950)